MGWFRSSVLAVCAGTLALVISSCDSGDGTGPVAVGQVQVSPATSSVEVGQTTQLSVSVKDADGNALSDRTVTWSSGSASVATVSSAGLVTGVSEGTATITATSEGVSGSASVTVTPEPVSTVEVAPAQLDIILGEAGQLTATAKGATGTVLTGRGVIWTSSDDGIATVDAAGEVTSVAVGTATITATSEGKSGTATVNVLPMPVETVEVAPGALGVAVGLAGQLTATTKAADGTVLVGRTIVWSTSDGGIATVDATGMVTGVAVGAVTITATSEGKSGTAAVTVTPAAFNPGGDVNIGGDLSFESVNIPAGVTVTVTGDLDMDVTGDVVIAGTITSDCVEVDIAGGGAVTINGNVDNDCGAPPAGGGPPLTIIGNGTFDIDGSAMASDGDITLKNDPLILNPPGGVSGGSSAQLNQMNLNGPFPCTLKNYTVVTGAAPAASGANGNPTGGAGSNGTGFIFACNGDLAFKGNVQIETQEGGTGGSGTDQSNTAAVATGGAGGWGGGLFIWAFGNLSFTMEVTGTEIKNHFFSGRGGDGGIGTGTGLDNDNVDPAASGTGTGGAGGAAGIIDFQTSGDLSVAEGVLFVGPGTSAPSGGADGGGDGGAGVGVGAHGRHADNRAPGKAAQVGGAAVGLGGVGGDAPGFHTIILGGQTGFEDIVVDAGDAGWGGDGDADAGWGGNGDEDNIPGADGGQVTAKGGAGGDAFSSRGGSGGDAYFRGAQGGDGWDDCILPEIVAGGPGGNGGAASGGGGPLGSGMNPGSVGRHFTQDVSNGGDGGNGAPVGAMGLKGAKNISDPFASGPGGGGNSQAAEKVEIGGGSFMDGNDGSGCNLGGWFDFGISVQSDPAGHHPFVGMPGQMQIWVGAIATGATTGTFFLSGSHPLPHVEGTWNPETGEITASGVGTVAGIPNTQVTFTGTFIDGVITGTLQMGGEGLDPGAGGLPGGIPIKYTFTGTRAPG